jgi:hypothetical protein
LIFTISSTSSSRKYLRKSSMFHVPSSEMKSATRLSLHFPCFDIGRYENGRCSQGSRHARIWLPLPTLHTSPFLRSSRPYCIACQDEEALPAKTVSSRHRYYSIIVSRPSIHNKLIRIVNRE